MQTTKQLLILAIIVLFTSSFSFGITYTTINGGDWSNTTNVWSTDGVTPCGCTPQLHSVGNDIIINHPINLTAPTIIGSGSTLTVNPAGSLDGAVKLTFVDAVGVFNGNVTVQKLEINANSTVNFTNSVLTVTSRMDVFGTVNVDGGYLLMTGGNIIINQGAQFNTTNAGKVDVQNGNISNSGEFNLCATCCFRTTGNWKNFPTGQVLGSGAATSTNGNMTNQGFWSPFVAWCSAGNPSGMPGFENCTATDIICALVILPVEMGEISATINATGVPQIDWFTVSEKDNDYFKVLRLTESKEWELIGTAQGAGSTTERQDYQFTDTDANLGTNYYLIEQVDFNGASTRSEVVSVEKETESALLFPNPAKRSSTVQLILPESSIHQITIFDALGSKVYSEEVLSERVGLDLDQLGIESGVYLVSIQSNRSQQSLRLIVD